MLLRPLLVAALLIAPIADAAATNVFKCVARDGSVSFQDKPCRTTEREHVVHLPDAPPPPSDPATGDAAPAIAEPPLPPETEPPPAPPPIPPPAFYLCTRYDGSRYISDTGQGRSTAVPLGVAGVPSQDLAHAYGPGGIGVSAPGLRTIPHQPASSVPFGGAYTWVDDECHFAAPREACAFLGERRDDVQGKLRRAFSDEEPKLKQEEASLRERMRGC